MQTWEITEEAELGEVMAALHATMHTTDRAQVVALHGDLGAGKTTFTQHLARELGVMETVTSPTFVIMKQYETTDEKFSLLVHIDAYRIEADEELTVLGFTDLLPLPNTLVVIEWAEKVAALLPQDTLHLTFVIDGDIRRIELTHGQSN